MKAQYFIRTYKYDLAGAMVALFSTLIPLFFNNVYAFISSLLIIVASLLYVIFQKSKDKEFYYLSLQDRKNIENWIGSGFQYKKSENCYLLNNAEPGVIFSPTLNWSDYRFRFQFKIEKNCVGIIVRAVNLSNYVMLQIRNDCIRPHVRVNGGWSISEPNVTNFYIKKNLSSDTWYTCETKCENDSITIVISKNKKVFFNRIWQIPKGSVIFNFRESDEQKKNPLSVKIPFSINLEYGAAGFRNSSNEIALVKEVLIEKI